ncbi:MAG: glycosyltransferase family 2 protein [Bacteroidales bacterium]|nr:glycosyltransferase family 2 protein [Bacteroidales bacterium]
MTAIIILNWNGWKDTLACLDSLSKVQGDFRVLIVDNNSSDDSVERIQEYLSYSSLQAELFKSEDNLGFAKGNNEGLRYIASHWEADFFLLLNNDTIVEPDFLAHLEDFAIAHPEYKALTPMICYNYDRSIIWNCGGELKFGLRKAHYGNTHINHVKEIDSRTLKPLVSHIDISYLTGCALFFRKELLDTEHRILTEDYFFGEEDFNFCLRMKQIKARMACVLSSRIYHKVNGSIKDKNELSKIYIYYLNRYIDIRKNFSPFKYFLWETLSTIYAVILLKKRGYGWFKSYKLMKKVEIESSHKEKVTQRDFIEAIEGSVI